MYGTTIIKEASLSNRPTLGALDVSLFGAKTPGSQKKSHLHLLAHHHSNVALFSVQFAVDIDRDLEKHVDQYCKNTHTHDKRRGMEPMMNLWESYRRRQSVFWAIRFAYMIRTPS